MGNIIGFSGKIGSGKTTLAKFVHEQLPEYEIKHFATALKQASAIITGLPEDWFWNQDMKNQQFTFAGEITTVGAFLQWFGTDVMRKFDNSVWVKALFNQLGDSSNWIIDDVRFINEANAVSSSGLLIRLEGDPAGIRANSGRNLTHQSEIELDDWVFHETLITNQPIEKTKQQLIKILNAYL